MARMLRFPFLNGGLRCDGVVLPSRLSVSVGVGPGKPEFFQLRRTETRVGTVTDPFRLSRIGKGTAPLPFVP